MRYAGAYHHLLFKYLFTLALLAVITTALGENGACSVSDLVKLRAEERSRPLAHLASPLPARAAVDDNTVTVSSANMRVRIQRDPWHLAFVDAKTGAVIVEEEPNSRIGTLGYGIWAGVNLNIYEGYLTRIGADIFWTHAKKVEYVNVENNGTSSCEVNLVVSTHGLFTGRLLVTIGNFTASSASVRVMLEDSRFGNRVGFGFRYNSDDEKMFGFGERFNAVQQRGNTLGVWCEDGGWDLFGRKSHSRLPGGKTSTYVPMPWLLSSRGYGLDVDTFSRSVFHLGTGSSYTVDVEDRIATAIVRYRAVDPSPRAALQSYLANTGTSLVPPAWAFGPWNQLGGEFSDLHGQDVEAAERFAKEDIPVSHCVDTVHFLPTGDQRGREQELIVRNSALEDLGIKSTSYFNGYISTAYASVYSQGLNRSYYVLEQSDHAPYQFWYEGARAFRVSEVDFTENRARQWYGSLLNASLALGFRGHMYDYGEYTAPNTVSHSGIRGTTLHNEWPILYQETAHSFYTSALPCPLCSRGVAPDVVFYVRSGYRGSQRTVWAHWTGDPSSDWSKGSGIAAQIPAMLSLGLSGMCFTGSDIGGFEWYTSGAPSFELWTRWSQLGAISPFMHTQTGGKGFGPKTKMLDFPDGVWMWRRSAKLHNALFPYWYSLAFECRSHGIPLLRHHIIEFPGDATAIGRDYQFTIGPSLLSSPVIVPGQKSKSVYLPNDHSGTTKWLQLVPGATYDEETGMYRMNASLVHHGGEEAQLNDLRLEDSPLFLRSGSIVPLMDPRIDTLNAALNSSVVSFSKLSHRRFGWSFLDDLGGASADLFDGSRVSVSCASGSCTATASYPSALAAQCARQKPQWILQIPLHSAPTSVVVDGAPSAAAASWREAAFGDGAAGTHFHDADHSVLWLRFSHSAAYREE